MINLAPHFVRTLSDYAKDMEVALRSEEKFLFQIKGFEYKHKYSKESKCSQQTNKLHCSSMYRLRITLYDEQILMRTQHIVMGEGGLAIHSIIFVSAWETNTNRLSHEHRTS